MNKREIKISPSLREQTANILRGMILGGELLGGDRISERELSINLKVSTTPIKEALRIIQSEGLIVTIPRKGSFVIDNIRDEIIQLTYLRSAVDGIAAYFAAELATKEQVTLMQSYLDKAEKLVLESGETPKLSEINADFHQLIRETAGSFLIMNIGANMRVIDESIRRRVNDQDFSGALKRHKEHQEILNLISKHDSKGAEKLMIWHIRQGIKRIVT